MLKLQKPERPSSFLYVCPSPCALHTIQAVSSVALNQEIHDLRKGLQDISTTLEKIGSHGHTLGPDHFQDVMGHFIAEATDEIQSVFRLQASAMEEFANMVSFLGEDPHEVSTSDIFTIFYDFVTKFERAHRHNMIYKRH